MTAALEIGDILGVAIGRPKNRNPSLMRWVDLAERGVPISALDQISKRIAPSDVTFKYRIVPKATLARAKNRAALLSPTQSTVIVRLAKIWSLARMVWGSDEAARNFLLRQHQLLDGRRPIDVAIENELGAELVREILGRLQNGSAV
jgi:putative toxin-antitoxin system antitoxin component (TIGR02293 family)